MQSNKRQYIGLEQLELFRPKPTRPQWETLPIGIKNEVTVLLAQLIADSISSPASSDQKELIDE